MLPGDLTPAPGDLTPAEARVMDGATTGERTDFQVKGDFGWDGSDWGLERTIRAEVLLKLLTVQPPDGYQPRVLAVAGARISGQFAAEGLSLLRPLVLQNCLLSAQSYSTRPVARRST